MRSISFSPIGVDRLAAAVARAVRAASATRRCGPLPRELAAADVRRVLPGVGQAGLLPAAVAACGGHGPRAAARARRS